MAPPSRRERAQEGTARADRPVAKPSRASRREVSRRGGGGGLERLEVSPRRFKWTPRLARLLGKQPDHVVAARAGVSVATVAAERKRRGIQVLSRRRPHVQWTEEMIAHLGTAPDRVVASELGLDGSSVTRKRRLLGIAPFVPPTYIRPSGYRWTARAIALLGTDSDRNIAKRLGLWDSQVSFERQRRGIPPFKTRSPNAVWTPELLALLGTVPDKVIARRMRTRAATVTRKRRVLGIAAYYHRSRPISRDAKLVKLLALPNAEIMRRTGIAPSTVSKLRREYGIKPPPRPGKAGWAPKR